MLRICTRAALGVVVMLMTLEAVFRVLPVSTATMTGYHFDPDLLTYPAHHRWRVATGWDLRNAQELRSNNVGFAADIDFTPDEHAVALIGDSYVEASMLSPRDRPGAQLQRLLPARKVYAMGSPGSALLDYGQRIRWASDRFQVRDFVVLLEGTDARQSLCGSGNVHSRCLDARTLAPRVERQPPPGAVKRVLRHSALAQYLAGQIRFRPKALVAAMFTRTTPESLAARSDRVTAKPSESDVSRVHSRVDAVVGGFFETVRPHLKGKLIVLVDGRRDGAEGEPTLDDIERSRLIRRLGEGGAHVVDLVPVYARHARQSRRTLDVGPYDGHLNRIGVALAMQQASAALHP